MPQYWMITNRNVLTNTLGDTIDKLSFWVTSSESVDDLTEWQQVSAAKFQDALVAAARKFPVIPENQNEDQKHVTLFVHGYNNTWKDAVKRYQQIARMLYQGSDSMGVCILYSWPSNGKSYAYLPDRADAASSGPALADILCGFYDWLVANQEAAAADPSKSCKAKVSIIAHSMGNYVLQKAMQSAWTRKNRPQLVSLLNQCLLVAADVDNDLFKGGEVIGDTDGDAMTSLSYRITALYSGRDSVLGASAGLKHFGKRRLGRSGLDRNYPIPDNLHQEDCTNYFADDEKDIHSAYFRNDGVLALMRQLLRGIDRIDVSRVAALTDTP